MFDFSSCRFTIERAKESTARVVLYREFGVLNSFTLESTYCGVDIGMKRGLQIQIGDLQKIGEDFCFGINSLILLPEFSGDSIPFANANETEKNLIKSNDSSSSSSSNPPSPKIAKAPSKKSLTKGKKKEMRPGSSKKSNSIQKDSIEYIEREGIEREGDCPSDDTSSSNNEDL